MADKLWNHVVNWVSHYKNYRNIIAIDVVNEVIYHFVSILF